MSQYVDSTNTTFNYSITEQTKNGVVGDYGFTIDPDTGLISVPSNLPDPTGTDSYVVSVSIANVNVAETDWQRRSTASGVLWAHDFREQWEVDWFRVGSSSNDADPDALQTSGFGYGGTLSTYKKTADSDAVWWDPDGGIPGTNGGCLVNEVPVVLYTLVTPLNSDPAFTGPVMFSPPLTPPTNGWKWDETHGLIIQNVDGGPFEYIRLTGHVSNNDTFTIQRGGESSFGSVVQSWAGGDRVIVGGHAGPLWNRPFAPLRYAAPVSRDDIGYNPADPRGPVFNAYGSYNCVNWAGGYLRNPQEQDLGYTWADGYSTDLDASEIYIQMRLKLFNRRTPRPFQPANGKFFYIDRKMGTVSSQEIIIRSTVTGMAECYNGLSNPEMSYPQGNPNLYSPSILADARDKTWQPGGEWEGTCTERSRPNGCFLWPDTDENTDNDWITFLIHIKPGVSPQSYDLTTLAEPLEFGPNNESVTIPVADASLMPPFIPGVRESEYWVRIDSSRDLTARNEYAKVIGIDTINNTITVNRANNFGSWSPSIKDIIDISVVGGVVTVTTATSHGIDTNEAVYFVDAGGVTQLNGKGFYINDLTSTTFSLKNVDGSAFDPYVGGGTCYNAGTREHAIGDIVHITSTQQLYARWQPPGRDWRATWDLRVAYPGDTSYRPVFTRDDYLLFMSGIGPELGWNRLAFDLYHNGAASRIRWGVKMAQIICSTEEIPVPLDL